MPRTHHSLPAVAVAASLLLATSTAAAQAAPASADSCTVDVAPHEVGAGVSVVEVTTRLSRSVGDVTGLAIADDSGIELSSKERLEWLFAAAENDDANAPRPIETGAGSKSATLRLNLLAATPGSHRIVLHGERGSCRGTLTVRGSGRD